MAPLCKKGDRVKCLATRFDEGSEDRNGVRFSIRHAAAGNGTFCFGSIAHVYALTSSNPMQTYRVKYDDGESHKSIQAHLFPASLDDDGDSQSEDPSADNQAEDDDADDNRDAVVTDSDDDMDPHGLDDADLNEAMEMGDSKVVGGRTWVRVEVFGASLVAVLTGVPPDPPFLLPFCLPTARVGGCDIFFEVTFLPFFIWRGVPRIF